MSCVIIFLILDLSERRSLVVIVLSNLEMAGLNLRKIQSKIYLMYI